MICARTSSRVEAGLRGMRLGLMGLLALAVLTVSACNRRPHVDGALAVTDVLKAWTDSGFDTEAVESVEPGGWSAGACSRGPVGPFDVLLCEYAGDHVLASGEQEVMRTWQRESPKTGLVLRNRHTLLAIADRNATDQGGRTLMRLATAFRDLK